MSGQSRVPLFIECRNPRCRAVKEVRNAHEQKRRQFCSRRCAGLMKGGVLHLPYPVRLAAARKSQAVRRRQTWALFRGLTKAEVFRRGYSTGWKAGARSVRRRLQLSGAA